jgi:D-glycero-alpha-D-manno-heptose-7-phosphate kinase
MTTPGISTDRIDRLYDNFVNRALAGKVSGAGGGSFIMFLVHPEARAGSVNFAERGCEP